MADLALVAAGRVHIVGIPVEQLTLVAGVAVVAGAPVRIDSAGKWALTDANGASTAPEFYGIATNSCAAGMPLTAIKRGRMDGFVLDAVVYGAGVFTSATIGLLADATSSGALQIGRCVPALSQGVGVVPDKILEIGL